MQSILITGNMGYVGPCVVRHLRLRRPQVHLTGLDTAFFASNLMDRSHLPERMLNAQHFADVRGFPPRVLDGIDSVVHLAAISNDPMGNAYERVTQEINEGGTVAIAREAKKAGVRHFVFASSCSVYGFADDGARTETSSVNPLTAYARSKVASENALLELADKNFIVTCLRFATACGASPRLRLDLVLNDFVASAVATGSITILSDGTPWRPLIALRDMARAIDWAVDRETRAGGNGLVVNTGSDNWNYQVRDLAEAVARALPGTRVSINPNAAPDKRSYRVDFSLFQKLAPDHQPLETLESAILELKELFELANFADNNFRNSDYMRLNVLSGLMKSGQLNSDLYWQTHDPEMSAAQA